MGVKCILHGWVVAITELGEGISGLPVTFTWKEVRVVERLEAGAIALRLGWNLNTGLGRLEMRYEG